jgi:hypothetical protein
MRILVFIFCLLISSHTYSQANKQATLIIKKTADWCPFCGTYGWDFFKKVQEQSAGRPTIMIANHYSGGLSNINTAELNGNFSSPGQPVFFANGNDLLVGGSNFSTKADEFIAFAKAEEAKTPLIDVQLSITQSGTGYAASVTTTNNAAIQASELTLSVFQLRNNFIAYQASVSQMASHINVFDKSFTPTFGNTIYNGNIANGTKRTNNFNLGTIALHNQKTTDVIIAAIVWRKETNGRFTFINGTTRTLATLTTSIEKINAIPKIIANQRGDQLVISVNDPSQVEFLRIISLKGNSLKSIKIDSEETMVDLNQITTGTYILNFKTAKGIVSQKVFLQN